MTSSTLQSNFLTTHYSGSIKQAKCRKLYPTPSQSEVVLWERFRTGKEDAFNKIYQKYVDVLYSYGKRYCSDPDLIKDCIQDFFLYLREKRSRLGTTTSIKFYLLRSFRRRLYNTINKTSQKCEIAELPEIEADCWIQDYIDDQAKAFMIKKMNKCLEDLRPKEREALYFYYFENLSYSEIAAVMNYTHVSSARRLVYAALSNMKRSLS